MNSCRSSSTRYCSGCCYNCWWWTRNRRCNSCYTNWIPIRFNFNRFTGGDRGNWISCWTSCCLFLTCLIFAWRWWWTRICYSSRRWDCWCCRRYWCCAVGWVDSFGRPFGWWVISWIPSYWMELNTLIIFRIWFYYRSKKKDWNFQRQKNEMKKESTGLIFLLGISIVIGWLSSHGRCWLFGRRLLRLFDNRRKIETPLVDERSVVFDFLLL